MIKIVMLMSLGFFIAVMLMMFVAPAFFKRAARLTTVKLQSKLPYTLSDFEAQKDQIKAEFAIRIRRLEVSFDQVKENSAKLRVNLNKREMEIQELKSQNIDLRASLAEKNSRAVVLEQTVRSEIPALNHQLLKIRSELVASERLLSVAHENIENQDTKLSHAARTERIRQTEIERLRTVVSTDNPKNPVKGHLSQVDNEEFTKLQDENRRLLAEAQLVHNELVQLRNFEEREAPMLKQELKDLGNRLLHNLAPEAAPINPNGSATQHHNTLAERLEKATNQNKSA